MRSSWPLVSLADAGVELLDCVHKTPPAVDSGYPYVAIPQMKAGHLELDGDARRISEADFRTWTKKVRPIENDVVLSRRCNPGETAVVRKGVEFALGQNLVLLRTNGKRLFPPYLRWVVRSPAWWGEVSTYLNVGAVFDSLRCADVPKFRVPLPPLRQQERIATVLGALDDKIELNRKMNETLEKMAQAIFKSWFVDFDGHTEFQDSELGRIPKGWRLGTLSDLLILQRGFDLPAMKRVPGVHPVVAAGGLHGTHSSSKVKGPCVVTGRSGKLGQVLLVWEDCWPLNTTLWVKEFREAQPVYAYHLLKNLDLARFNSGSAVPTLNRNHIHEMSCAIPQPTRIKDFERVAGSLLARSAQHNNENATLAELRDTLLPKLISGELRVKDAEKLVRDAT